MQGAEKFPLLFSVRSKPVAKSFAEKSTAHPLGVRNTLR
jgi:hypothetical protein